MRDGAGSACASRVSRQGSEHVEFAALDGKHAGVGFVSTFLPFHKETKFLKMYGLGSPISIVCREICCRLRMECILSDGDAIN
jgi:hypothetical protein